MITQLLHQLFFLFIINVSQMVASNLVYSCDTITGEVSQKEVTDTFVRTSDHINYLTIIEENGHEQIIETTDSHPFWVVTDNPDLSRAARETVDENGTILYHENIGVTENGYWVEAKDLKVDDIFLGANGELSTLVSTERVEFPEGITVYNFTVDGNHDYFVIAQTEEFGQTCVLVHNAGKYTTEPTLPPKTIVQSNGVEIVRNVDDHPPAHLHVKGQGQTTRIGMNGKPLKNDPELSPRQRKVVEDNISTIRSAVRKIRQWFKYQEGQENG